MIIESWEHFFCEMAKLTACKSKDPSTKVGAVIVDDQNRIRGHGFNGFPRGVHDHEHRYADKEEKYCRVVHAEVNAILNSFGDVSGCTLYVTPLPPCTECAKIIIQAGIKKVRVHMPVDIGEKWVKQGLKSKAMMIEAGLEVDRV